MQNSVIHFTNISSFLVRFVLACAMLFMLSSSDSPFDASRKCLFEHMNSSQCNKLTNSGSGGGGGPRGPWPPPPVPDKDYLLCTSWHFLVKRPSWLLDLEAPVYNLRAKQWFLGPLFYIFSKKFSTLLHSAWILFFFPILLVSLCSLFHSYFIFLCACFYIILTQAITFLACKVWNKVFLHTLLHKNVWELTNIFI